MSPNPTPELLAAGSYRADGRGPFAINDATTIAPCDRSWRNMLDLMRADVAYVRSHWKEPVIRRWYPGIFIAWCYRLSHTLHVRGARAAAILIMWICHAITGAEIRPGAILGPGLMVVHPSGIVVNGGTVAGARLQLYGANLLGVRLADGIHGSPRIGDDVIFTHAASALGPVVIGDRALIGVMSLVLRDVPPDARVKGIPAR